MKYSIIGTAGHVDHGKTMLIKALTGMDTSHLEEEKKRGITIELGFAYLKLPDGGKAGIVDVPGHEKFIKNMLAGVGGMDLVLLVVAADEGVMPQTREHMDILSLLNIKDGIIVLTKTDMVDKDWLELVKDDVREEVQDTFLRDAPMCCVSSLTGEGIDELRQMIFDKLAHVSEKNESAPMRIPVDRVFSVDGFGTVITGTMIEGTLREGEDVTIYPSGLSTKVRSLQVHSTPVKTAYAGQRVAVNLAGIKKENVCCGDYIAAPGSLHETLMLDVKIKALPHIDWQLLNNSRLHFYHGAGDTLCKLVLLDRDALQPGEEAYAQLRFTEPVTVKNRDCFVVRFYSPLETVGGGIVLDSQPKRHKRYDQKVLDALSVKESGSVGSRILQRFRETGPQFLSVDEIFGGLRLPRSEFDAAVSAFLKDGSLIEATPKVLLHRDYLAELTGKASAIMDSYHRENPLQAGIKKEELRSRLLPMCGTGLANSVLEVLKRQGLLEERDQRLWKRGFKIEYSPEQEKLMAEVAQEVRQYGFEPPTPDEIKARYAKKKEFKGVWTALFDNGDLVLLSPQIAIHRDFYNKALEQLKEFCAENHEISLAQFRDLIGTSRKFALPLLEHFDKSGLTKKQGDVRILLQQ